MKEQTILQSILKHESWDDLIVHVVTMENIDPWDIDLVKLSDSFLEYIEKLDKLDFRIPAKIVLVSAILLKLKSEVLNSVIKTSEVVETPFGLFNLETEEFEKMKERMNDIDIQPKVVRRVKRKVTLDELVGALRKAVKVHHKRKVRKRKLGKRIEKEINITEEDIENRIMTLMDDIDGLLVQLESEQIEFSNLVKDWSRDNIITYFMPLLHLSNRGEVLLDQEEFFKEILISRKN